jgi:hypothetical protein
MSALLGLAMLAMPVAAEAHSWDYYRHRAAFPAYNRTAGFRSMVDRPMAFAPPMLADNRPFMGSAAPMMPVRNYYGGGGCAMPAAPAYNAYAPAYNSYAPAYNPYANAYQPAYMPPAAGYATPYYVAPMGGGLASMLRQRDSAEYLYQLAVQRGNRVRAKHLGNDVAQLNKNIANARMHDGLGRSYGSFNPQTASAYGNQYGYGNSGLGSLVGPLMGNYIH